MTESNDRVSPGGGSSGIPDRKHSEEKAPSSYLIQVSPRFLVTLLAILALTLLLCHAALTIYHYQVDELPWLPWRQLFDVDEENNLPTWFSELLLLTATVLLWLCAGKKRRDEDPSFGWYVLTIGFFLLAIDEVAGIHETINSLIDTTWAIGGGLLALGIGLGFIPFLWRLPRLTAILFALAGAIYVGGAVGVEIIGEPLDSDSLQYNLLTVLEEGMEMFGVIFFIHVLLGYMREPRANILQGAVELTG